MIKKIKPLIRTIRFETEICRIQDDRERTQNDLFGLDERCIPLLDVLELEDEIKIKIELPGVQPKDISILLERDAVEVRGNKNEESIKGKIKFLRLEREYGRFRRYVSFPSKITVSTAKAVLENGILTITAKKPKQEENKESPIKIQKNKK